MGVRGFDEGLAIRRAVLGDEYVDRALASADDFLLDAFGLRSRLGFDFVIGRPREWLPTHRRQFVREKMTVGGAAFVSPKSVPIKKR